MKHRERLIAAGVFKPMDPARISERNDVLFRIQQGERVEDPPIYCVFRRDEPFRHVILSDEHECAEAELIESRLRSYEANALVNRLNYHDPEQPGRERPYLPPVGMYAICRMEDWSDWENRHNQLMLEEVTACG